MAFTVNNKALRNEQAATLLEFIYHSRIILSVGGSVWYMIQKLRCTVTIDSVLANSKTVLVVAQSISEISEGLTNNPVYGVYLNIFFTHK